PRQRAAREDAQQAEDRAAASVEVVLDRLRVDPGSRDPRTQPVAREDGEREDDAATKLGDPPRVSEPGEQGVTPPRSSARRPKPRPRARRSPPRAPRPRQLPPRAPARRPAWACGASASSVSARAGVTR